MQACTEASHTWMSPAASWLRSGVAVTAASILVALGGISLAAAAAAKRTSTMMARWTLTSAGVAVISAVFFMTTAPPLTSGHLSVGGPILILGAVISSIAASVALVARTPTKPPAA